MLHVSSFFSRLLSISSSSVFSELAVKLCLLNIFFTTLFFGYCFSFSPLVEKLILLEVFCISLEVNVLAMKSFWTVFSYSSILWLILSCSWKQFWRRFHWLHHPMDIPRLSLHNPLECLQTAYGELYCWELYYLRRFLFLAVSHFC